MNTESYDRSKEIKQFEDSKLGVKGLVDSGITTIPRFFIHPPETLSELQPKSTTRADQDIVPIIDLTGADSEPLRPTVVEKIARASRELGFFQIVNHGVGVEVLERVIAAVKGFHEQSAEVKAMLYRRGMSHGVSFYSNIELFHSAAACWRDTLQIFLGPTQQEVDGIPEICRNQLVEWNQHVTRLGELLMGLLCEGLGVDKGRLKDKTLLEEKGMLAQYYPHCPQPGLTLGLASHSDSSALTILLQDHMGGLQIKYSEEWVDVKPVPGGLVINIGNILQIISNDEYKSVEHRVLANPSREPRISIGVFFSASDWNSLYGPLPELISGDKPAHFRQFTYADYMKRYITRELVGKSLLNYYRLSE